MKHLKLLQENITLPAQPEHKTGEVFVDTETSAYTEVDTNLEAWLPTSYPATEASTVTMYELTEHLNNEELIEELGGLEALSDNHFFCPQEIQSLLEKDCFQKNGMQNLFFTKHHDTLYIVGVMWEQSLESFVPYIYRTRNLYRSWSKGNRVFVKG